VPVLVGLAGTFPLLHVRPLGLLPAALLAAALWIVDRSNSGDERSDASACDGAAHGDHGWVAAPTSIRVQATWTLTV
jgi:hypothetical protein